MGRPDCCSSLLACRPHLSPCPQTFGPQLAAQISEPLQFVDYLREPKRDEVRLQGGSEAAVRRQCCCCCCYGWLGNT